MLYTFSILSVCFLIAWLSHYRAKQQVSTLLLQQRTNEAMARKQLEQLQNEVGHKNHELGVLTMHIVSKNDTLTKLKERLAMIQKNTDAATGLKIRRALEVIRKETEHEKDWPYFELHFDKVYKDYLKRLRERYPQLKSTELMLCVYIRMSLSNKEIASLMNNTIKGVEGYRYRLRKSLGLHPEDNLKEFLFQFDFEAELQQSA